MCKQGSTRILVFRKINLLSANMGGQGDTRLPRAAVGLGTEVSVRLGRENGEWEPPSTREREEISRQDEIESSISTDEG